jgi:hypothetical protein
MRTKAALRIPLTAARGGVKVQAVQARIAAAG